MIGCAPVAAGNGEAAQCVWDTGVYLQAVQRGLDAKDILAHIEEGPCGSAGQPAVLCFAKGGGILTGHHLAVNIGFGAVDLGNILDVGRACLAVHLKGPVAMPQNGFGTADPRIVVAEDTGVLLVSRRIAGNFARLS